MVGKLSIAKATANCIYIVRFTEAVVDRSSKPDELPLPLITRYVLGLTRERLYYLRIVALKETVRDLTEGHPFAVGPRGLL